MTPRQPRRQTKPKTVEPKPEVERRYRVAADQGDPIGEQQTKEQTRAARVSRQKEDARKLNALWADAPPAAGLRTLEDIGRKVDSIVTVMWLMVAAVGGLGVAILLLYE